MNMQFNPQTLGKSPYSPNFTARNEIIRDADKICRAVNSRFPHISPTYRTREIASNILNLIDDSQKGFKNSTPKEKEKYEKYESLAHVYVVANNKLEVSRNKRVVHNGLFDYFSKLISNTRCQGLANCAELSEIALLMCKNKNFDNVKIFELEAFEKFNPYNLKHLSLRNDGFNPENLTSVDLDHVAVSYKVGNKTVVVDPWLGIADFVDNYKTKIKTLYKNLFIDLKDTHEIRLKYYDEESDIEPSVLSKLVNKFKSLNVNL